jgi:hypothetical protein
VLQGIELGANVEFPSGYPDYFLAAGFYACEPPDAKPKGWEQCKTHEDQANGIVLEM